MDNAHSLNQIIQHFGSTNKLAEAIDVSIFSIYNWRKRNKIPDGMRYKIQVKSDNKFIAEQINAGDNHGCKDQNHQA